MTNKLFNDEDLDDNEEITIPDDEPLKPFKEKYHDEKGIARALIEKENFIKQLKGETANLRSELASRSRVEETVDRLLNQKTPQSGSSMSGQPDGKPAEGSNSETKQGLSMEDVKKLLEEERAAAIAEKNVEDAKRKLADAYGADWQKVVAAKGKEIGESAEFFDALARKNPNALLAMLGTPEKKPAQQPSMFTGVNTTGQTLKSADNTGVRNKAYYDKLKSTMKIEEFFSPRIQNQMHADALKLGPDFYR